jgi:hypothetical protein
VAIVGLRFCTYNLASTLDGLALTDKSVGTEKHDTDLAGLEVHAHALDTGGEPELFVSMSSKEVVGGIAIATYSTSSSAWTLFMPWTRAIPSLKSVLVHDIHCCCFQYYYYSVPNGEDTAGLGETGLLLDTTDPLLEDRGDLGGGSLSVGSIAAERVDDGGGVARLY